MPRIPISGDFQRAALLSAEPATADMRASCDVDVLTCFETAEPVWREMIQSGSVFSGYQDIEWLSRWWDHVGVHQDAGPFIVVLKDHHGQPGLLLPLMRQRRGVIDVATFMGGKHANFNLPLWRPGLLQRPAESMRDLIGALKTLQPKVDLLAFVNQPAVWRGEANPVLMLAHQVSSNRAYSGALQDDYDALLKERMGSGSRKKLRQKERRLAQHGGVRYWQARSPYEISQVLETFFAQKGERMHELGLANVFADPGIEDFITAGARGQRADNGLPIIELYAMSAGDVIIATLGGISANGRLCGMFNSMAGDPYRNESPGELLLANVIRLCCQRGLDRFDLGIGDAAYKEVFCNEVEPLFDSVLPITLAGAALAPAWRAGLAARRELKKSQTVMQTRRFLGRLMQQGDDQ